MRGKAMKCSLVVNTRSGHACKPIEFPSVAAAVRWARSGNGGFAYRVLVGGRVVRRGLCDG